MPLTEGCTEKTDDRLSSGARHLLFQSVRSVSTSTGGSLSIPPTTAPPAWSHALDSLYHTRLRSLRCPTI